MKEIEIRDSAMRETKDHVIRVGLLMMEVVQTLQHRAIVHDRSKFSEEEFPVFAENTHKLKEMTYGSDEYKEALKNIKPALDHHYQNNSHHPEHYQHGINDMDLIDLIEMLADWKAATERHKDGDLYTSIIENADRFGYDEKMTSLLVRTSRGLGWI